MYCLTMIILDHVYFYYFLSTFTCKSIAKLLTLTMTNKKRAIKKTMLGV